MKVCINWDREGWLYTASTARFDTYALAKEAATLAGFEVDNAGWLHKMLSWNWNYLAMDGYKGWEISNPNEPDKYNRAPAFVKLSHTRGGTEDEVESNVLCNAWDNVAAVDFYQRDWTDDGIPFVEKGGRYWSGWWFQTVAERDRFVAWLRDSELPAAKNCRIEQVT